MSVFFLRFHQVIQSGLTDALAGRQTRGARSPASALCLPRSFLTIAREWRRRMTSRRELAGLSHLDLKDLGHPAEVAEEKAKPFWKA